MKIMVCLKQVPHQDARLDIDANGTWIQEDNIKFEINSYDTYALEEALRNKDAGEAEVLVVSIGPDRVTQALRTALGMGADRADGNVTAVPPMVAELVGVPHTTGGVKVEKANGTVTVEREVEGGVREVVELQSPCLIAVQTGLNQVRYASLKGIMAAKKKPLDVKSVADLGLAGQVGAAGAKVKIEKIAPPARGERAEILEGSPDEVAAGLVGKIKELGLL